MMMNGTSLYVQQLYHHAQLPSFGLYVTGDLFQLFRNFFLYIFQAIQQFQTASFSCKNYHRNFSLRKMSGYNIVWAFFGVAILSALAYIFTPKGNDQTVIRTVIIMSLVCCYLMWAITYLAQLHPLIYPKKVGLRPPHQE